MNLGLEHKVAIITGGAKGIGAAITRAFAAEGAVACIFGRNREEAAALVAEIAAQGGKADSFHCEMTDEPAVRAAVAAVQQKYGRIDSVVNNAGVNDGVGLRSPVADFRASLEKNIIQCFVLVQASLDALIASKGTIINIGSKCAVTGQGGTSGYVAAKGAMNGLTREWALDLAKHGIRVNAVLPAEVMTPLYERWLSTRPDPAASLAAIKATIPLERRMTTSEEIADTVVFVASPRSSHTTGQILYVDGGYVHFDRACTTKAST
ncbi:SDR family oxidoreductase [Oleiharenicola lentus]|uniref:SDR family oxidoreductase n=1 Tax=Oleiharenicola lentus TaxID=2508720 RepID=A0A4Q1C718_9BACT|nr:SDR family oxidoreductase [Oleiharenicola lentus]RXK54596.1 SDR family oxidoreductase [Oleiharenicola lentus]